MTGPRAGDEVEDMEARLAAIARGERAPSVWMFEIERGSSGAPEDFRLREAQLAEPDLRDAADAPDVPPLAPGDRVSAWSAGAALGGDEPLLDCMRRLAARGGVHEYVVAEPGPPPRQLRVRIRAIGGVMLLTCEDITVERKLLHQLTLHRTILDTMCEGVCLVRASDARIAYANAKFAHIMGYAPGELAGQPSHLVLAPASAVDAEAEARAVIDRVTREGDATYEAEILRKDGARILCSATGALLHDDDHGDVVLLVQQDITAQRRTAVERDGFFLNALDMLCITDFEGRFRRVNPAWTEVLGWSVEELTGRAYIELVHPDDRARTLAENIQRTEGHATYAFENRYLTIDGSYRVLSWRSAPSMGHRLIFACARDVTELRRTEQALRDADAEKATLLKEIHHRVKNNLQVISSLLKLRAETLTSAEARHALQDSQDRVRSIALLHEKLYRSTDLGSVDLGEYAEGLFATLLRTYRLDRSPELVVEGNALQLGIGAAVPVGLLLNELMTNALKHAFTDSPRPPRIEVTMREAGGSIEIVFADNGGGYPRDAEGAPSATLGMELVHTLATQVGGELELTNAGGARCRLRFPRDLDAEA